MATFICIQDNYYLTVDSETLKHTAHRIGPRRYHWPQNMNDIVRQFENPEDDTYTDADAQLDNDYRDYEVE